MRALSTLTNRVFLACALGFTLYFVNQRVAAEAEAELRRGLREAATLVDQHRATLTDTFTRLARLVADLPKLKAAVATGDAPTVQPLAEDYLKQVNADLLIVAGRAGNALGTAGIDAASVPVRATDVTSTAEIFTFWPHPRGVLQVVSVPILIGVETSEVLGRLTVGFFLDDRLAQQFKDVTGSEIAFGADGEILASTLPAGPRPQLARAMRAPGISSLFIGDEEFIALQRSLAPPGARSAPVALVLRSRTQRLQFLQAIRTGLVGTLIVTVLIATIVSYAVARTMTRPLAAITRAMGDVAATGDLTRKVVLRSRGWDDEDARLLATAFNTLTESIARFQHEAAQKERLSSLGRLSTVIAHEIRNPLMIIRTSLRTLRRGDVTATEVGEAVHDIDEETTRLNRIVTEVLDFARPIRFDYAEADLNALCAASAQAVAAGDGGPPITLQLDPAVPRIVTDGERLRTALVNMLVNARHAVEALAPADSAAVAVLDQAPISLATHRLDGGRVRIVLRDRGVGIAAADLAHIFDPYFTTRRTGTGLGLPIARNIIEGLGGSIAVSSRSGAGTEIVIELPPTAGEA